MATLKIVKIVVKTGLDVLSDVTS